MSVLIHPTALVSPKATIGVSVEIGPFCIVEDDVIIGEGSKLVSNVTLANGTRIGNNVVLHSGAVIGTYPQDLKFAGEATEAIIGDRTVVREYATVNRGTLSTGRTMVGADVLLMAYVHVAHDCVVSNKVIIANSTQLGGHVSIGYHAVVGGLCGVHQFCAVGEHAMVAGTTFVTKDIPPFALAGRSPVCVEGLNAIGLRRRGFSDSDIAEIQSFYRQLYTTGLNISDAIAAYQRSHHTYSDNIKSCIDFISKSKRGIARFHS